MIFTVIWLPAAEQDLASLWIGAAQRNSVSQSANQIDRELKKDPIHVGQTRSKDLRSLHVPPLSVLYRIREDDRIVEVIHVWTT